MAKKTIPIIVGAVIVFVTWAVSGLLIWQFVEKDSRGTFGDMFGAINALFSGLALFGIIISILIQQNELNLQRKELKYTRKEFQTNRVTNILFKQIEYINHLIDQTIFNPTQNFQFRIGNPKIDTFLQALEEDSESQYELFLYNSDKITRLISLLHNIYDNLEETLRFNELEDSDLKNMKNIFSSNINPDLEPFLIKVGSQTKTEIKQLELGAILENEHIIKLDSLKTRNKRLKNILMFNSDLKEENQIDVS